MNVTPPDNLVAGLASPAVISRRQERPERAASRRPYSAWLGYAVVAAGLLALVLWLLGQTAGDVIASLLIAGWATTTGVAVLALRRLGARLRIVEAASAAERDALKHELEAARDTLARQQQALVQTEKMAAMGKMAAGVAHEIANPLASMDSILQLAQRKAATSNQGEGFLDRPDMVHALRQQVSRIDRIVSDLTCFAHPNGERLRTVPLCELISQSLDMLRFDHRLREVDVRCECDAQQGECHVRVVPQRIHQVLVNLVLNALDAMADVEEPRLMIRTCARGGWYTIEVADNGPGIKPEHLGRVFEPFFTTKPPGCGTGLGLWVCSTIVQQHGGRLSVDSTPGHGATFSVTLPAAQPRQTLDHPAHGKRIEA